MFARRSNAPTIHKKSCLNCAYLCKETRNGKRKLTQTEMGLLQNPHIEENEFRVVMTLHSANGKIACYQSQWNAIAMNEAEPPYQTGWLSFAERNEKMLLVVEQDGSEFLLIAGGNAASFLIWECVALEAWNSVRKIRLGAKEKWIENGETIISIIIATAT